ncbi:hypothetical protein B0T11DRAFT_74046 [Plectosphaerella cucumerina]|uniref:Uncharacterized protein n=1 Tax=Plectosphaerella cucumerina TaxID=40658 RepID=A0A8K0X2Q2_9PEZI|nr:hypothetical protein B0T11DRAFT_74046 [Plectosphaerella cucumerina]
MRFFSLLGLASFALAAPAVKDVQVRAAGELQVIQARQQTVLGTIVSALGELQSVTTANLQAIQLAASETKESVDAAVLIEIQTAIRANAERIAAAIRQAAATITAASAGAGGNLAGLTQEQLAASLAQITAGLNEFEQAVRGVRAQLQVSVVGVNTAVRDLAVAQLQAIENSVRPFVDPIRQFVRDVQDARVKASGGILGLGNVVSSLTGVVTRLVQSLGLNLAL